MFCRNWNIFACIGCVNYCDIGQSIYIIMRSFHCSRRWNGWVRSWLKVNISIIKFIDWLNKMFKSVPVNCFCSVCIIEKKWIRSQDTTFSRAVPVIDGFWSFGKIVFEEKSSRRREIKSVIAPLVIIVVLITLNNTPRGNVKMSGVVVDGKRLINLRSGVIKYTRVLLLNIFWESV